MKKKQLAAASAAPTIPAVSFSVSLLCFLHGIVFGTQTLWSHVVVSYVMSGSVYRCGRTIGHLSVGDFAVAGVPFFLYAFLVSS